MSKVTNTVSPSLKSSTPQDLRFNDTLRLTLVPTATVRKAAIKSIVEQAISLNANWDRFDKAAVRAVARHAASIVVTRDAVRLLDGEGKSLAWVNKNHMDFPGTIESIRFSTHRLVMSGKVAA